VVGAFTVDVVTTAVVVVVTTAVVVVAVVVVAVVVVAVVVVGVVVVGAFTVEVVTTAVVKGATAATAVCASFRIRRSSRAESGRRSASDTGTAPPACAGSPLVRLGRGTEVDAAFADASLFTIELRTSVTAVTTRVTANSPRRICVLPFARDSLRSTRTVSTCPSVALTTSGFGPIRTLDVENGRQAPDANCPNCEVPARIHGMAIVPLHTETQITRTVQDRVLIITLNRPDRLNAFTLTMAREIVGALDFADENDNVRAVIFTGAGRGFCAGADLGGGSATFDGGSTTNSEDSAEEDLERIRDVGGLVTLRMFASKKPLIAAINGPAVGVGITMTLPMDIRLCSTEAKFGFVFARRGIVPEAASTWFLPRIVGISQAAEWCFTGRVFGPDEALHARLVTNVHPPDDLLAAALGIAGEIATSTSAVSVALTRQMLWHMLGAGHPMEAHQIDSRAIEALGRSRDAHEGVQSFLDKRPPAFVDSASTDLPPFVPWWPTRTFQ
jgi:enoyl-CoA hydratase/carnithine racemase